jgi:hypothetical protein
MGSTTTSGLQAPPSYPTRRTVTRAPRPVSGKSPAVPTVGAVATTDLATGATIALVASVDELEAIVQAFTVR